MWAGSGETTVTDQPSPTCRASLLGKPARFTNAGGTRSYLHTCGSIRVSSRLMGTSEEDDLYRGPEQQEAGRLEGREKVETAGGEAGHEHLPSKPCLPRLRSFNLIPRARDNGVGVSTTCFRKCPLSALQRVNWLVITRGQG